MKKLFLFVSAAGLLALGSCSKSNTTNENGPAKVQFILTDAPADYNAINLDIKEVKINTGAADSETSWVTYPVSNYFSAPVNVLKYKNGNHVVMGEPLALPAGHISQLRLVLGDNNTVVVDGVTHNLTTPSAQQSGYKVKFNETLDPDGVYRIWLDFDAARSVVKTGNGKYILKPVVNAVTERASFGAINGFVLPADAKTTVYALRGTDTVASAIPEIADSQYGLGYFRFINLDAGSYNLVMDADNTTGYRDTTLSNVVVETGKVKSLGTLTLVK